MKNCTMSDAQTVSAMLEHWHIVTLRTGVELGISANISGMGHIRNDGLRSARM